MSVRDEIARRAWGDETAAFYRRRGLGARVGFGHHPAAAGAEAGVIVEKLGVAPPQVTGVADVALGARQGRRRTARLAEGSRLS